MTFPMAGLSPSVRNGDRLGHRRRIDLPRTFGQAQLFGEDQARYVVTCRPEQVEAVIQAAKAAGVPASWIGSVTGSAVAILGLATVPLARLRGAHELWFPAFMAGEV